ncbi:MAG: hypothetical protein ACLFM0_02175 [Spirochaetales bacterium]
MGGIVFLKSTDFTETLRFYTTTMEMSVWLEQPDITILQHENLLVGFQNAGSTPGRAAAGSVVSEGKPTVHHDPARALLTFFYPSREQTDAMYRVLSDRALAPPNENTQYRIYNFYARDPENRLIECQTFLHELPAW